MITLKELKEENKKLKLELTKISIELAVSNEKNKALRKCVNCFAELLKTKKNRYCEHCENYKKPTSVVLEEK